MTRDAGAKTRLVAWLICVVMAWLSLGSPHCDLCDGPWVGVVSLSLHHRAHAPLPEGKDECNGVCTCCGFHWAPETEPVLSANGRTNAAPTAEAPALVDKPHLPFFRPPRMAETS